MEDRSRYVAAAAGVAVLATILGIVAVARSPHGRPRDTAAGALPGCVPDATRPARAPLTDLAHAVAALTGDAPTGKYTYVRARTWSVDTTAEERPEIANRDERLWWTADRSGRRQITVLPSLPLADLATAAPDPPTAGRVLVDLYRPGELALVVDRPSADPAVLAAQLAAHEPPSNGHHATVRAVADMYRYHAPDPAQRAAALLVLADTDGLTACGTVTDRFGRTGLAISADSDGGTTRHVLAIDSQQGSVLGYERVAVVQPPQSSMRTPGVTAQVLFLTNERTDTQSPVPQSPNGSSPT
ncbi:hypothetical protein [Phytohabitans rumicis]|uniref:CU044_5270 family protein n=1 Tax=Phytohabitans rumicis TaxID=1076125 RepID=A0A6V8L9F1_9ACTN|nr:hypothetical protein [Phytohabitans rumicis]GFJ89325.1 hypothetical protein Prum_029670 [Phytohabitans rumicis]